MTSHDLAGKTILITGASGFIGHALASSLARGNCTIIRSSRNAQKLSPLQGAARVIDKEVDYNDPTVWQQLTSDADTIYYLGAQTSANDANRNPVRDFEDNVAPLLRLLQHCRNTQKQPTILFASTATVVGLAEDLPIAEDICENPITVYDIHKLSCEKYLSYYAQQQWVRSCSLRLANIYGPGTASAIADRGVLNQMIRRAANGENLTIYGAGDQMRDYTYIADIVAAFESAATCIEQLNGRYFNIGSGKGHNFVEAFNEISKRTKLKTGLDVGVEHIPTPADIALIEKRNYVADTTAFAEATGWSARVELSSGIDKTLDHYRN